MATDSPPAGSYFAPLPPNLRRALPPALGATIAAFADRDDAVRCASALGSFSNCGVMSHRFVTFARARGHEAEILFLRGLPYEERHRIPPVADPRYRGRHVSTWTHHVVRLDGQWIVDWTARQFDPAAEHPLIRAGLTGDSLVEWQRAVVALPADQPVPPTVLRRLAPMRARGR